MLPAQYGLSSYIHAQPPPQAAFGLPSRGGLQLRRRRVNSAGPSSSLPQVPAQNQTHPFDPSEAASRSILLSQPPAGLHATGFSTDMQMELRPLHQEQPLGGSLGDARASVPLVYPFGVGPGDQPGGQPAPAPADQDYVPLSALTAPPRAEHIEDACFSTSPHTELQSGVTQGPAFTQQQQQQHQHQLPPWFSNVGPRLTCSFNYGAQGQISSNSNPQNALSQTPLATAPFHSALGSARPPIQAPTPGGGSTVYQFQGVNSTSRLQPAGHTSQNNTGAGAPGTSAPVTRRYRQRYQDMQTAEAARNRAALQERASAVQGDPRWAQPSVSSLQQQAGISLYGGNNNDDWDDDLQAALAASVVQFQQEQASKGADKGAPATAATATMSTDQALQALLYRGPQHACQGPNAIYASVSKFCLLGSCVMPC